MRIEDLNNLNLWWKFGKDFWKYDKNLKEVKDAFIEFERRELKLKRGNIYVLRGVRQSGKTTYIKQTILNLVTRNINPNTILYVSCDKLASRKELGNIVNNFVQMNRDLEPLYIFLDEITYLEDWNLELKTLADSNLMDKLIIFATGSNPVKMKEKTERMPGRRVEGNEYYFKPITFGEFALQTIGKLAPKIESDEFGNALIRLKEKLKNTSIDLEQSANSIMDKINSVMAFKEELDYLLNIYLLTGGFPAVINEYLDNRFAKKKETIKNEAYETLIRIILGDISKIRRSEQIGKEIIRGIAKRCGTRYSFSAIGKDAELSHQTVIEYLELFENSFMAEVVYPFDVSRKKPMFKGEKKIYFLDPFIYHAVSSFLTGADGFANSKENLSKNKDILIESVVSNHLIQTKEIPYLREWKTYLGFFYSSTGREIDFIYRKNKGDFLGIEVKYREESKRKLTKIDEIKEYIVLTKSRLEKYDNALFIPVSLFLALLKKSERLI